MHRIEGLSEHFVYFNDDMFLLKKTEVSDFFEDGLPCDQALLDYITRRNGLLTRMVMSFMFLFWHFFK